MPLFPMRGEIWYARFPGETKVRLAVIVSIDSRNERGNNVLAVPITANMRPLPTHVELSAGEGGLTQDSMARCENISALPKSWLARGPLGSAISAEKMTEMERAVQRAIGIPA